MNEQAREDPWSVTARELRGHMRTLREDSDSAVVVTVADVEGSAYRRPGARMVVGADGEPAGAVTAGCLEDPVTELSLDVLSAGESRVEVFDLMDDDDDTWGLGLGCNGIIDVLLEPLDASWDRPLELLSAGEAVTVLTVVDSDDPSVAVGDRTLVRADGEAETVPDREPVPAHVREATGEAVTAVRGRGTATTVDVPTDDGAVTVLVDGPAPVSRLLLFGSQRDVHPVCRLAATVGLEVTVHSPRGARDADAFPDANRVETGHPSTLADSVRVPSDTYAVVMSHNLIDDQIAVETLLEETAVPYIGLMGPRDRFEEVREASDVIAGDALDRIATPVGLDVGGGEPIEIAFSIVGELLAVSNDRDGGRLKSKNGPIHSRVSGSAE